MSKSSKSTKELFKKAHEEGSLSAESLKTLNVVDIGAQIQAALGVSVDDVVASEVVLVTMMVDDSGSIRFAGNTQVIRDGHNLVLESLSGSKQKDNVLLHTRYLNGEILFPYCSFVQAVKMDSHNYNPSGGTPLYDQTVVLLGTVLAKQQEFSDNGVPVRTVTLIMTDGHDEHSPRHMGGRGTTPSDCVKIVTDMLKQETHIIAAMGVDDGTTNYREVFREMGIPEEWILTPGNNPKEIRKAFQLFSQSAVRASQSAESFSKTSLGGFEK